MIDVELDIMSLQKGLNFDNGSNKKTFQITPNFENKEICSDTEIYTTVRFELKSLST